MNNALYQFIALNPYSIEKYEDWLKISPFLGQSHGNFIARLPKKWLSLLNDHITDININGWGQEDTKKLLEFFCLLNSKNAIIPIGLNDFSINDWSPSILNDIEKFKNILIIDKRKNTFNLPTFDNLTANNLRISSSLESNKNLSERYNLFSLLSPYLKYSGKIAFVDRNNYLVDSLGRQTLFLQFLAELLSNIKDSKCHEIIIYAKFDQNNSYLNSKENISKLMLSYFSKYTTPIYGVRYIFCNEIGSSNTDLHERKIVTNYCLFRLADSISGHTKSHSLTRVQDENIISRNIDLWLDDNHGMEVVLEHVFHNKILK
jgi:hypothetical protein